MEGREAVGQSARKGKAETPEKAPQSPQDAPDEPDGHEDDPDDVKAARAAGAIPVDADVEVTGHYEPPARNQPAPPPRQTDEEWLAELPLSAVLTGKPKKEFERTALNYRQRETLIKNIKLEVGNLGKPGSLDPLDYALWRVCMILAPKAWKVCPDCDGSGQNALEGTKCGKCHGRGFDIH